ncbi:MAG: hypothetical protein ACMX3H_15540 [Sodalis sp. (in: enterobacteria)]|uniref:hypothetical protein n=1 Tax=Sodalis sp. (in: enterobacteria) TaxID=1898979 RepID=UPI0039E2464A
MGGAPREEEIHTGIGQRQGFRHFMMDAGMPGNGDIDAIKRAGACHKGFCGSPLFSGTAVIAHPAGLTSFSQPLFTPSPPASPPNPADYGRSRDPGRCPAAANNERVGWQAFLDYQRERWISRKPVIGGAYNDFKDFGLIAKNDQKMIFLHYILDWIGCSLSKFESRSNAF